MFKLLAPNSEQTQLMIKSMAGANTHPRPALQNCVTACYSQHFYREVENLLKHIHIYTSIESWEKIDSNTLKCSISVSALLHLCEFRLNPQQRNKEEFIAVVQ